MTNKEYMDSLKTKEEKYWFAMEYGWIMCIMDDPSEKCPIKQACDETCKYSYLAQEFIPREGWK